jgi:hypothetical protein
MTSGERRAVGRLAPALVVLAILFSVAVRIRLADVPFERDEGEYAYAGQLVLQGVPPYDLAYNMKFPGTYYAYAAILAVFGESPRGVHLGLLLVNAATIVFVFLLGRRLLGEFPGAVAACAFALLSLDSWIMGIFAHATHFVALPVTAAAWLLLRPRAAETRRALLAVGAILGGAVLMKQHALVYLPFGAALVAWNALRQSPGAWRAAAARVGWLAAGAAAPFGVVVGLFLAQGVLGRFWFWTFRYASEYVSEIPLAEAPQRFMIAIAKVSQADRAIWVAAALGFAALWIPGWSRESRVVICGLLAASLLAVCPGFHFREHYFIVLLPVVGILVGLAAGVALRALETITSANVSRLVVGFGCLVLAASYVVPERDYLFHWSPSFVSRVRYGPNPFVESPEIARYIRERTTADDRIAVIGSEPQIYFYARRRSATGYIYMYPLMEPQKFAATMQDEMIRQIQQAHPLYLVSTTIRTSWLTQPDSDERILEWSDAYTAACYDLVGVADVHSKDTTSIVWDEAVRTYHPLSANLVFTYRRKSEAPCVAP